MFCENRTVIKGASFGGVFIIQFVACFDCLFILLLYLWFLQFSYNNMYIPAISIVRLPTTLTPDRVHSTVVPFSAGLIVTISLDV